MLTGVLKRNESILKMLSTFHESYNLHIMSFMTEFLSYRNQSIGLLCKSMDWFAYDKDLRHEIVKEKRKL